MPLHRILDYAHLLIKENLSPNGVVIDGTCGNGHDTLFLASLMEESGHVYAFDIQEKAITETSSRLEENKLRGRVSLIHDSHANVDEHLSEDHRDRLQGAIFNLGYLPGSDKSVVTTSGDTILSVEKILSMLDKGGLVVLGVYHGHEGGQQEKEALIEFVQNLDQKKVKALHYGFMNIQNNPPFIIALEKQKPGPL
ncbi:methyltransferase domain-containing protein [Halobacillus fulvus]|nr:methyltransferase domain-containing protein [Halobacillus fulvus]